MIPFDRRVQWEIKGSSRALGADSSSAVECVKLRWRDRMVMGENEIVPGESGMIGTARAAR